MVGQITTCGVPTPIQAGRRWAIERTGLGRRLGAEWRRKVDGLMPPLLQ
jgi:hypothetical protein